MRCTQSIAVLLVLGRSFLGSVTTGWVEGSLRIRAYRPVPTDEPVTTALFGAEEVVFGRVSLDLKYLVTASPPRVFNQVRVKENVGWDPLSSART